MAKGLVTIASLTAIADAIRAKNGGADTYKPSEMAQAISDIQTGITPSGTIQITENGTVDVTNYASAEVNVAGSGGSSTKYGVSIDSFLGDIDSDGVLQAPAHLSDMVCNATSIGYRGLYNAFYGCTGLASVDLSSLTSIASYGLCNAFYQCTGLASVDLSSLISVEQRGLYNAFYGCTGLTGSVSFPSLSTDGVSITGTSVSRNPFYNCFCRCNRITELHFPSAFSAYSNYLTKTVLFGGTSSTYCNADLQILFDL